MTPTERAAEIATTQSRLTAYIAAESQVLSGQSYTMGNKSLERADLGKIQEQIIKLRSELFTLRRGNRIRVQRVVFRDGV